ncbi:hypothetical protein GF337_10300, partial [candidate division KSB1 bacterium]|nr:hypothetical protein [candidate division KSB1 bacterium]
MNRYLLILLTWLPVFILHGGVEKNGSIWYIDENSFTVQFNEKDFSVDIQKAGGNKWQMDRNKIHEEIQVNGGWSSLSSAKSKSFSEYQNGNHIGVNAHLVGFPNATEVEMNIYVYVDVNRDECVIEIDPTYDPNRKLGECQYPRGFEIENSWGNTLVNPAGNGGYGSLDKLNNGKNFSDIETYAHGKLYMAWWGYLKDYNMGVQNGEGFIAMVGTPYDFSLN